ncbi:N-acetylmuramoyl-L-alanine amidase [Modicisalibacter muralis]|nr:N-acetylmuramoyl-L-alanine amidase [Halomonas muralis]
MRHIALLIAALLAGCSGPATLERRNGYVADHQYTAPSHSSRVRYLVLHYTDGGEARSLATLTGPNVSVHYVVPLPARWIHGQPRIYQLVDESRRAWHAGVSAWKGRHNLNDTSIGIEIVNRGPTDTAQGRVWAPYPPHQIDAVIALARDIIARHGIDPTNVVGHSDIAPSRKIDPGPRFPWRQLHAAGIGAWPDDASVARYLRRFRQNPPTLAELQCALAAYGYPITISGRLDDRTHDVLRAFTMHFRPDDYLRMTQDKVQPDAETAAILWALLEKYRLSAACL